MTRISFNDFSHSNPTNNMEMKKKKLPNNNKTNEKKLELLLHFDTIVVPQSILEILFGVDKSRTIIHRKNNKRTMRKVSFFSCLHVVFVVVFFFKDQKQRTFRFYFIHLTAR